MTEQGCYVDIHHVWHHRCDVDAPCDYHPRGGLHQCIDNHGRVMTQGTRDECVSRFYDGTDARYVVKVNNDGQYIGPPIVERARI